MLNKLYLALLAAALIVMSLLTFYTHRQLESRGFAPAQIAENFLYFDNMQWRFLWVSAIGLFVLANVLLWLTQRSWALWLTLAYFAGFILLQTWWLSDLFFDYRKLNGLVENPSWISGNFGSGLFGAVLCLLAALIVFFDQFLVLRLRERMHPQPPATIQIEAETPPLENANPDAEG